jgi:Zn-dependent protease
MINKKEIISILIITAVLTISVSLISSWTVFLFTTLAILLIIAINVAAKKLIAYYLDSDIEMKMWEIKRYGFKPHQEFKKAFPAGIFLPILVSALTFGNLMWLASLVFEVKPKVYKAAKRHGLYSYSDITEYQIGLIAAAGVAANLIFAIISYFLGWGVFTRLSVWYAFFNMIPISDLDGNKIFFGNLVLWSFLASIVIIAVAYAFILI